MCFLGWGDLESKFWGVSLPLLIDVSTQRTSNRFLISKPCLTRAQMRTRQLYKNIHNLPRRLVKLSVYLGVMSLFFLCCSLLYLCHSTDWPVIYHYGILFHLKLGSWIIHDHWICFLPFCFPTAGLSPFQKCFCSEMSHCSSVQRSHGRLCICKLGTSSSTEAWFSWFSTAVHWFSGITSKPKNDPFHNEQEIKWQEACMDEQDALDKTQT